MLGEPERKDKEHKPQCFTDILPSTRFSLLIWSPVFVYSPLPPPQTRASLFIAVGGNCSSWLWGVPTGVSSQPHLQNNLTLCDASSPFSCRRLPLLSLLLVPSHPPSLVESAWPVGPPCLGPDAGSRYVIVGQVLPLSDPASSSAKQGVCCPSLTALFSALKEILHTKSLVLSKRWINHVCLVTGMLTAFLVAGP